MDHEGGDSTDTAARQPAGGRGRSSLLVVLCLVAVALVAWLWARGGSTGASAGAGKGGRPPATVGIAKVQRADMPLSLQLIGTVQPTIAATVRAQVSGVVQSIDFTEGQFVRRGQALAQIDPRPAQQALAQARGNLARDAAALKIAKVELERYRVLWDQDSIARQVLDTQAATVRQAEGTVAADRAAVANAEVSLGFTTIRAPVSGRIGLRQTDLGSLVSPSDTTGIAVVTVDAPIDVSFAVPQGQLSQVSRAARAPGGLKVDVLDQGDGSLLDTGRFLAFDNAFDPATGTIKGKARFPNRQSVLVPNQFVNVRLDLGTIRQALVVPVSAVRHGPQGDFVFVLNRDRTVRLQPVTVGVSDGRNTVVSKGLTGSETVVTEGADKLDDGSHVNLAGKHGAGRQEHVRKQLQPGASGQ